VDQHDVWFEFENLLCEQKCPVRIASGPAVIQTDILALRPTEFLESILERFNTRLGFRIAVSNPHQHADAYYTAGLLRTRGERPRRRCAEKRDECASFHRSAKNDAPFRQ
jgi:hypothetical protein